MRCSSIGSWGCREWSCLALWAVMCYWDQARRDVFHRDPRSRHVRLVSSPECEPEDQNTKSANEGNPTNNTSCDCACMGNRGVFGGHGWKSRSRWWEESGVRKRRGWTWYRAWVCCDWRLGYQITGCTVLCQDWPLCATAGSNRWPVWRRWAALWPYPEIGHVHVPMFSHRWSPKRVPQSPLVSEPGIWREWINFGAGPQGAGKTHGKAIETDWQAAAQEVQLPQFLPWQYPHALIIEYVMVLHWHSSALLTSGPR